jgi:hypothetical protein
MRGKPAVIKAGRLFFPALLLLFGSASVAVKTTPEIGEIKWYNILYGPDGNEKGTEETDSIEYATYFIIKIKVKNHNGKTVNYGLFENGVLASRDSVKVQNGEAVIKKYIIASSRELMGLDENHVYTYKITAEAASGVTRESKTVKMNFNTAISYPVSKESILKNDTYILSSADGSYKQSLNALDDSVPMGDHALLKFTNILPGKNYSLYYYKPELDEGVYRFENMPFYQMFPNNDK